MLKPLVQSVILLTAMGTSFLSWVTPLGNGADEEGPGLQSQSRLGSKARKGSCISWV